MGSALLFVAQLVVFACLPLLHAPPTPSEPQPAVHAGAASADSHADCPFCRIAQTRFSPEPGRVLEFATTAVLAPAVALVGAGDPAAPPLDVAAAPRPPPITV